MRNPSSFDSSPGTYSTLSAPERRKLIQLLHAEKRRLLRTLCPPLPESPLFHSAQSP